MARTTGIRARTIAAIVRAVALLVVLGLATGASAKPTADGAGGNAWPLGIQWLPADVDLVISVNNVAWASRQVSGKAGRQMSEELARGLGLPAAWDELWRTLDLAPDEAIDRLLGRRVVAAWRRAPSPQGAAPRYDWVLLSLVDEETERRVRERLRPAPRDVEAGQAILTLEDGRYLLTTRRVDADPDAPRPSGRGRRGGLAILMLAPAEGMSLFKQILPRLGQGAQGPSLGDEPTVRALGALLEADIAVVTRAGLAIDGGNGAPGGDMAVLGAWWRRGDALEQRGPGLDARIVRVGPGVAREFPSGGAPDVETLRALAPGVTLAVAGVLPPPDRPAPPRAGGPESAATVRVGPSLSATVEGVIRLMGLDEPARAALGPGALLVLGGAGRDDNPLWIASALRVKSIAAAGPAVDRAMAGVLDDGRSDVAGPDFGGRYPAAVRTAPVPEGSPVWLGAMLGPIVNISWQFPPTQGALAQDDDRPSYWAVPGWWVARLGSGQASAGPVGDLGRLLAAQQPDPQVATAGAIRPADLMASLAAVGVPILPSLKVLRWIPSLSWEGRLTDPERLEVELWLDLLPQMGGLP